MNTEHKSNTPKSIKDLWRTPSYVFEYFDERFNFTTDVAADWDNRFCRDHRGEYFDGLLTGWGDRNWCNPPYSNIMPWVKKAIEEMRKGRLTVMFIPDDMSVGWFKEAYQYCSELIGINGRISFLNAETMKPVNGNNKGSVAFIFIPNAEGHKQFDLIDRDSMK